MVALRPEAAAQGKGKRVAAASTAVRPNPGRPNPLDHIGKTLASAYFARHPDEALRRGWPGARELGLGTFGGEATWRWRMALMGAASALAELDLQRSPHLARAQLLAFEEWIEAELLLLDAQSLTTMDPAGYVQRVHRTLRATAEAEWLKPEERLAKLAKLLDELPAYFRDARISLIAPLPGWIDVALRDLADLQEAVNALAKILPGRAAPARPRGREKTEEPRSEPVDAIEDFRRWLMELRPAAAGDPACMGADEWARLVQLTSAARVEPSDLKARCLRDIARIECPPPMEPRGSPRSLAARQHASRQLALRVETAASSALLLGQEAQLLRRSIAAKSIAFEVESSLRTRSEPVRFASVVAGTQRMLIELPHPSWPTPRAKARRHALRGPALNALGVRYGLTGEALFERARRKAPGLLAVLPETRMLREAMGLYALDWASRIDWVENAFRASAEQLCESDRQRAFEAARLIAALELHAEGLSLAEAALGFQRRTAVDEAVALHEALEAQRDPRRGLGYLGWLEVRALEERLAARMDPRKALNLALRSVLRHPELRPSDLTMPERGSRTR